MCYCFSNVLCHIMDKTLLFHSVQFNFSGFYMVLVVKNPPANVGDTRDSGSIPGWGRSLGVRNDNTLHYSCRVNPVDTGAWWSTVNGIAKSWTWQHTHISSSTIWEKSYTCYNTGGKIISFLSPLEHIPLT